MPENQEIDNLRALDPNTITEVHNRYFPEILRYAQFRLGDPSIAEDIACEVFVRLLEALHSDRGPSRSLRGWLFGTASNLVNDSFRRAYKYEFDELREDLRMNGEDPLESVARREALTAVQSASTKLTSDQQHVLALRFGSALNIEETAEIMGKNPNAIKALQFRALKALRRHLGVDPS